MQKIIPCLWFDSQAQDAVNYYTSLFEESKIGSVSYFGNTAATAFEMPKGTIQSINFELLHLQFMALNGSPQYHFTPAISFSVNYEYPSEINRLWKQLSSGGKILMDLQKYSFSEKFGWVTDRFGISWQLNVAKHKQKIAPYLVFADPQKGYAEKAIKLYRSLFKNAHSVYIGKYEKGQQGMEGSVSHADFDLNGQSFMAMDSTDIEHYIFTPAISFFVNCDTQEEIDTLWEKLSYRGMTNVRGWTSDQFGVSWQIVPTILNKMMQDKNTERTERVMATLLKMDKINIEKLKQAYKAKKDVYMTKPIEELE